MVLIVMSHEAGHHDETATRSQRGGDIIEKMGAWQNNRKLGGTNSVSTFARRPAQPVMRSREGFALPLVQPHEPIPSL